MNENSLPVIAGKKQKIDLNDLQNVSQYLVNHEQVSNEHEMEGVMLCGESLVSAIYVVSWCIFCSIGNDDDKAVTAVHVCTC